MTSSQNASTATGNGSKAEHDKKAAHRSPSSQNPSDSKSSPSHDDANTFREQLDAWREQVDRLRAIAYAANANVQREMNRLIAELDKRLLMANEKFLSYLEAGDDVIEATRSSVEELWGSLKSAVRETLSAAEGSNEESVKPATATDRKPKEEREPAAPSSSFYTPSSPAEATTPNARPDASSAPGKDTSSARQGRDPSPRTH